MVLEFKGLQKGKRRLATLVASLRFSIRRGAQVVPREPREKVVLDLELEADVDPIKPRAKGPVAT